MKRYFNVILFLIATIFITACNSESSSKIIKPSEIDSLDFRVIEKYENGQIQKDYFLKNEVMHGSFQSFYRNGQPECKGTMFHGVRLGTFTYYDSSTGTKAKEIEYVLVKRIDSSVVNCVVYYDDHGQIDTAAPNIYYQIAKLPDTITNGSPFEFGIRIIQPYFTESEIIICDFDSLYNVSDSLLCTTKEIKDGEIIIETTRYDIGKNLIRGLIRSKRPKANSRVSGNKSIYTYFEIPFFVNER